jgi:hypothetical protein
MNKPTMIKPANNLKPFTETCNKQNDVQIIVDYTVQPNNKSDVEIFENRMIIISCEGINSAIKHKQVIERLN